MLRSCSRYASAAGSLHIRRPGVEVGREKRSGYVTDVLKRDTAGRLDDFTRTATTARQRHEWMPTPLFQHVSVSVQGWPGAGNGSIDRWPATRPAFALHH